MSPLMGSAAATEGNLGALLGGMDGEATNADGGDDVQVRSLASHEVTLYILEDDDESTTDQGDTTAEKAGAEREPLHASSQGAKASPSATTNRGSNAHHSSRHRSASSERNRSRSKSSSSSSSSGRSPSRPRSDSKGRTTSSQREKDRDRSKSPHSSTRKREHSSSSSSRRKESSPSPAPSRHRSRGDSADSKRKASPSPSSSRPHRHRDDNDERRRDDNHRHHHHHHRDDNDRRSRSSSAKRRTGTGSSGDSTVSDMDRSKRATGRRTRSRTPRSGSEALPSSPKPSSRGHHRPHASPSPPSTPSRRSTHGPRSTEEQHSHHHHHHRPHRSRSASCHRPRADDADADPSEQRRSRSASRPSRLPQYSSMQQQQLMRRLSGTHGGSDDNKIANAAEGKAMEPAAYVLSTPGTPPRTSNAASHAHPPTSTLRDAILEQTAKLRFLEGQGTSGPPRSHTNRTVGSAAAGKGSDPPGHYLGSTKMSPVDREAHAQRHQAPDPDAVGVSQVTGQPSVASTSCSDVPTASSTRAAAGQDPDHSTASASTSTSLQLFIRDPAQVNQLVSPRTIVTLDTKDSKLKVRKIGSAHRDYDNSNDSDNEDGAGDDMSIFSELWGSSVNVAAKVEEEKAVAHASNPNLKFELTSPQKASTQNGRKPPKKTKSDSSGKSMMRSLSDMLEANMGNLLDSPDRAKRRPRKSSPDRNSPKVRHTKDLLWDGTNEDEDDDARSLLLDVENAQKTGNGLGALNDDASSVPPGDKGANGVGQFGKLKEAGVSLFKSPPHWLKSPVATQVRPMIPPPPQPQPEQAPSSKVVTQPPVPAARGDSPETSETMAASFDSYLTENCNVAAIKHGISARKERSKKATKAGASELAGIDETLTAFSSILDANSELTKTEAPGFTKFVDKASSAKSKSTAKASRFSKVATGFSCPAIGNPLSGVLSTAQRVFRPRRGLSSAESSTPSPKTKRGVVNCYDMRGFDDEY